MTDLPVGVVQHTRAPLVTAAQQNRSLAVADNEISPALSGLDPKQTLAHLLERRWLEVLTQDALPKELSHTRECRVLDTQSVGITNLMPHFRRQGVAIARLPLVSEEGPVARPRLVDHGLGPAGSPARDCRSCARQTDCQASPERRSCRQSSAFASCSGACKQRCGGHRCPEAGREHNTVVFWAS